MVGVRVSTGCHAWALPPSGWRGWAGVRMGLWDGPDAAGSTADHERMSGSGIVMPVFLSGCVELGAWMRAWVGRCSRSHVAGCQAADWLICKYR